MRYILKFDNLVFRGINTRLSCLFLDSLMPMLTFLGGAFVSCTICLFLLIYNYKVSPLGKECLYALICSHLAVQVIKRFVTRARPYEVLDSVNTWQSLILKDYSFPSGHTAASFSIATVMAINYPFIAPLILSLSLLIGISRIYTGLHYPTDVFIGAILGIVFAMAFCL